MKVKAFSIVEVTVSMVVTAIVIGLVFIMFSMLSEQMLHFKEQSQEVSDLNRLCYAFNKDIFQNAQMSINEEEQIVFNAQTAHKIAYHVNENLFIRSKDDFIDTFHLSVTRFKIDTLFDKKKVRIYQRLLIEMKKEKKMDTLYFFKRINPVQLLEKEFKNED